MWKLSKTSKSNMEGVDYSLVRLVNMALRTSPVDFGIPAHGGLRLADVQHELFRNGKSKCDGFKILSRHQSGYALDFYAYLNGKASWDRVHLAILYGVFSACFIRLQEIGKIPQNAKLVWGGTFGSNDFKGWDCGHIEIVFE